MAVTLLLASGAVAQETPDIDELRAQLQEQRLALQEAIADREATAFRTRQVKQMLSEAEETVRQIEEEVKMLCEEREALQPGSMDECMNSSDN